MTALHEAIVSAIKDRLKDVYTALPGRIEKWDWATGKAHVKPQIQEVQDASGKYKPLPVITGVPVLLPGGSLGSLSIPLAVGDTGLLIFSKHALEVWLSRGGDVAPGDPREFDLSDAVFVPGLRPFTVDTPAESASSLVLKNGRVRLKMDDNKIAIGNDVAELLDLFDQLLTQIASPTAFLVNTGTGIGGLGPVSAPLVTAIQTKLGQIKGTL